RGAPGPRHRRAIPHRSHQQTTTMTAPTRGQRVLAIGLDGYEVSLASKLIAAGEPPALASLTERSARFRLNHGAGQRTGLAMEHVCSGRSPEAAGRWSA